MFRRLKLVPVTLAVALLLLTLKVGDTWYGALLGSTAAKGAEDVPSDPAQPVASVTSKFDVTDVSPAEIELLESLAARREELEARALEIDLSEKLLAAAEQRVDAKINELKEIQASVESLIKQVDEREEARIKSLVKIYERMKAKDAARIFNDLEMNVVLDVVRRMREAKAAAIMALMRGDKAKAVTVDLARRREPRDPRAGTN